MRKTDPTLRQRANMLNGAPGFAVREEPDGRVVVARFTLGPADGACYWLASEMVVACA